MDYVPFRPWDRHLIEWCEVNHSSKGWTMKVCEKCGDEIATRDGDNRCRQCEDGKKRAAKARRQAHDAAMRACGLVKVRGAMGGTYYE